MDIIGLYFVSIRVLIESLHWLLGSSHLFFLKIFADPPIHGIMGDCSRSESAKERDCVYDDGADWG
jgi:hypothetical protein